LIGGFLAISDLTVLNFLMEYFGLSKGEGVKYVMFITTSFIIATALKYFADKYWAFEKSSKERVGLEFGKFFVITLISGVIQIAVASFLFAALPSFIAINELVIGNIAKIGGIVVASLCNFLGYKFIVFKK
jgi:putative flippase GtrA